MKKYILIIFIFSITTNVSYAFGDFFRFESPYNSNRFYQHNTIPQKTHNFNRNNWSNPYDYNEESPASKFIKTKRLAQKSILGLKNNPDFEYLLSKMEQKKFGTTYSDYDIDLRLSHLETEIFGAGQSGDFVVRLNKLKRAFSSNSIDKRGNNLKSFFTSGMPTSVPMNSDYYSSLNSFDFLP